MKTQSRFARRSKPKKLRGKRVEVITPFDKISFEDGLPCVLSERAANRDISLRSADEARPYQYRMLMQALVDCGMTPVTWPDGSTATIRDFRNKSSSEIYSAYLVARERLEAVFHSKWNSAI